MDVRNIFFDDAYSLLEIMTGFYNFNNETIFIVKGEYEKGIVEHLGFLKKNVFLIDNINDLTKFLKTQDEIGTKICNYIDSIKDFNGGTIDIKNYNFQLNIVNDIHSFSLIMIDKYVNTAFVFKEKRIARFGKKFPFLFRLIEFIKNYEKHLKEEELIKFINLHDLLFIEVSVIQLIERIITIINENPSEKVNVIFLNKSTMLYFFKIIGNLNIVNYNFLYKLNIFKEYSEILDLLKSFNKNYKKGNCDFSADFLNYLMQNTSFYDKNLKEENINNEIKYRIYFILESLLKTKLNYQDFLAKFKEYTDEYVYAFNENENNTIFIGSINSISGMCDRLIFIDDFENKFIKSDNIWRFESLLNNTREKVTLFSLNKNE